MKSGREEGSSPACREDGGGPGMAGAEHTRREGRGERTGEGE